MTAVYDEADRLKFGGGAVDGGIRGLSILLVHIDAPIIAKIVPQGSWS